MQLRPVRREIPREVLRAARRIQNNLEVAEAGNQDRVANPDAEKTQEISSLDMFIVYLQEHMETLESRLRSEKALLERHSDQVVSALPGERMDQAIVRTSQDILDEEEMGKVKILHLKKQKQCLEDGIEALGRGAAPSHNFFIAIDALRDELLETVHQEKELFLERKNESRVRQEAKIRFEAAAEKLKHFLKLKEELRLSK